MPTIPEAVRALVMAGFAVPALLTTTETLGDWPRFPAGSKAATDRTWLPFVARVVSHDHA